MIIISNIILLKLKTYANKILYYTKLSVKVIVKNYHSLYEVFSKLFCLIDYKIRSDIFKIIIITSIAN